MDHIPNEILSHILSYLLTDSEKHRLRDDRIDHILPSKNTIEDDFGSWHQLLETDSIRTAVRHVAIETAPWDYELEDGNDIMSWLDSWFEDCHWPEFTSAINRICDMTNLNSLTLRFSMFCPSEDYDSVLQEPTETRQVTLELVSEALRDRESRPGTSTIRELVLSNLEDTPLPKDLAHNLLRNIDRLHISCTYAYEHQESPGAIPVEFNGKDLSFPRLKRLNLDNYIILRQDQFDWVLEQSSLIDLRLYNCRIATHCVVDQYDFEYWGVNLNGWKKPADSYEEMNDPNLVSMLNTPHFGQLRPGWYMSDLRWSNMFDRIHQHLPLLHNFTFEPVRYGGFMEHYPARPGSDCMAERYWTCSNGFWSTMWYKPARDRMWKAACFFDDDMPGTPVSLYTRTEAADRQALEKLMEATHKRRDGK
ncbi:hypothetical protein FACUT_4211 [Fusarium acutatum]|uniref:F-box domain-containing protein n=1 Tax=Fusarium acutatum TaxID=78861 RepID=A0A8H4NIL3_9HYPO|nr:hypothetical protein FACUT_4211 [Fusarium acutatum]